jgi:hypothetical protein
MTEPSRQTRLPQSERSLYDRDVAAWVERQVELLRSEQAAALDVSHLIEELEGLTKRDARALGTQLKRIIAHLLRQRSQPERASRCWADSIRNDRETITDILDQSPPLRRSSRPSPLPQGGLHRRVTVSLVRPVASLGRIAAPGWCAARREGPAPGQRRAGHGSPQTPALR